MSIAPFILLQQQLLQQQLAEEEEENRKRKEEEKKREEEDYAGMTSCTRTYEKIPFGVCMVTYPSQMYCNIYRGEIK